MASSEQPLKKRRLYEPPPESPPREPPQQQSPEKVEELESSTAAQPQTPPQLTNDEVIARRRNRDEIRSVYDVYKRLKLIVSQNEKRHLAELEQIYYSLIAASRGCLSVQRILADLIPRYVSYCPTALEAAAKALIDMHNSSLQVIKKGEDFDGVALGTARECIFGLADICCTASSDPSRSSVIRSICSEVFKNAFSFFMISFEEKDIYHFADEEILKMQDSAEIFSELKQKFSNEDGSSLVKLFKLRVLCFFRVLFSCPKNVLVAYFKLVDSSKPEGTNDEQYFLVQMTSRLVQVPHNSDTGNDEPTSWKDPDKTAGFSEVSHEELISDCNHVSRDIPSASGSCLLKLVLGKDASLRSWMYLKYKKLCSLPSIKIAPGVKSALEGIFELFEELSNLEDIEMGSNEDDSDPPKFSNQQYSVPRISSQHEISTELHRQGGASNGALGLMTLDVDTSNVAESSHGWSSMSREVMNQQMPFPATRTPVDFRSNSFDARNHYVHVDKNSVSNNSPAMPSSSGNSSNAFASPRHPSGTPYAAAAQIIWLCDGDSAAMDVFSASRQLWLGSLGPDTSEGQVRYQLERFAPLDRFFFFPVKGFAIVEYRTIIDAIRTREYIRSHFPWLIKFMDIGLGTRGAMNGIAIGSSCHVYVGSISSQWARDEILHESRKVNYRGPYMVTDLFSEGALLMEFETPEETNAVMMHIRQFRKEKINNMPHLNAGSSAAAMPPLDGARSAPTIAHPDIRSSNPGVTCNTVTESPHAPTMPQSPADSSRTRMSHLSSLFASLRSKYNINQTSNYFESFIPGSSNSAASKGMDQVPTNTLWICLPNASSPVLTDDELMAVCNVGVANIGSIVQLTRSNLQMGCGWFVECSSAEAANALWKNLHNCPGMFLLIEFSQPGNNHALPPQKPDGGSVELVSPRINSENQSTTVQAPSSLGMVKSSQGATDQMWMYNKNENEMQTAPGSIPCIPLGTQGPIPHPQQFQPSPFPRPVFAPPNSSWDPQGINHHAPYNPVPPLVLPNTFQSSAVTSPYMPAPVTPGVQMQQPPVQHFDQMFPLPVVPHLSTLVPPQPDVPPPLPSSPPPAPPPPSSPPPPPPPPVAESTEVASSVQSNQYLWQGSLSKSGVHYCTIYANRLDSDICKYSGAISEPVEWPTKLDMTKRTDFRHVKSTFSSIPPHKREVCRLIPSTVTDQKGFQDFISYLKQRDCAGVIKIPVMKSMWSRLLFIMTYSEEICSLLSIPLDTSIGLIALVLPKETNFEWA